MLPLTSEDESGLETGNPEALLPAPRLHIPEDTGLQPPGVFISGSFQGLDIQGKQLKTNTKGTLHLDMGDQERF